jgi:TPP-dependent pyruvate/acetoin dehydrogenase alpha subunit
MPSKTNKTNISSIDTGISPDILLGMYESMLRIRRLEEEIAEAYKEQEMRCPTHLSIGQEAAAVGVCAALKKDDVIFSTHRCHAHYLAKGGDPRRLLAELYGKKTGCAGGKGGSMHLIDESVGMLGTSSIVGASVPLAVGAALAFSMQGNKNVAVTFQGDAGVEQGVFHESLNFAALKKLPVLFVCENNLYATQSPLTNRHAEDFIYKLGEAYGIPGARLDGNDVLAVYNAAVKAIERCRRGQGPTLLELMTYRWREHVGPNFDWDMGYRSKEEVEEWMEKCPVKNWKKRILEADVADEDKLERIGKRIEKEIKIAFALAKSDPFPDDSELMEDIY